ncbi:K(+) efflux antiporter 6-like [Pyrus ussuriensis x Pyrus communis]|uniref:K(+) efflux antiporter 6-like n=1 Tax=Pyrus ussuriensis x Pyrus communis TaxID=2448454 RepID=A0A5N5I109_9ROSA|nr:K(+) efflux antiporter 6-like [Pyrus ussuriensis x Pyrus communis]
MTKSSFKQADEFATILILEVSITALLASRSFQLHDVFNLDNDNRGEDTPTLIDCKDNVFIISNFKSKYPVMQLDLRLISDLGVVFVSATCGGIAFACAGQPV